MDQPTKLQIQQFKDLYKASAVARALFDYMHVNGITPELSDVDLTAKVLNVNANTLLNVYMLCEDYGFCILKPQTAN